jgi:pSer/pThr/pTyr-binding forkhead associated (FHA) protein
MEREIICDYCGNRIQITDPDDIPADCPNCNSPLEYDRQTSSQTPVHEHLSGFTLTYLKTNEAIAIKHDNVLILGREAVGRELFEKVGYISREHCKIEVINNQYCVTDLGSTNGTYAGSSRIDCFRHPRQILQNGEPLTLGRETFRVTLHTTARTAVEEVEPDEVSIVEEVQTEEEASPQSTGYECQGCHAYVSEEREFVCPKCGSYND